MSTRTATGMNPGFSALYEMGCRQFRVHTEAIRQTVSYEVSFSVPIIIGGQNGLSVVVRGDETDDPFEKAIRVARELLETYPRAQN